MKLAVFGATGRTGGLVVEQALAACHTVTAVARRPSAITLQHEWLAVVRGDLNEPDTVKQAAAGQNAIICAIGVTSREPTTLYSAGTTHILNAMQAAGVNRLISISSAGLEVGPGTPMWQRVVIPLFLQRLLRNPYADMARMEALIRGSAVNWTIIRAPRLIEGPRRGGYRIAVNKHLSQIGVTRANLANCIIACLADPQTYRARVELAYA